MQESDLSLMISGIQHFVFCKRQWALIHIENQWSDNFSTVTGNLMHEKAHSHKSEKRGNVWITRGLQVASRTLQIHGVCDVVECIQDENGITLAGLQGTYTIVPIEYKKGSPKTHNADKLQLCAQAVCLEEMIVCEIPKGYLFYGREQRRKEVDFTPALRNELFGTLQEMHTYYRKKYTPKVKPAKHCKSCSLDSICLPSLQTKTSAKAYFLQRLKEEEDRP